MSAPPSTPDTPGRQPRDAPSTPAVEPPSRLRHLVLVAIPLAVILGVVAVTYVFYTRHREQYFTQRYVRALAALAEQTEGAIVGLDSAVHQAENEWAKQADQASIPCDASHCLILDLLDQQLKLVPIAFSPEPAPFSGYRPSDRPPGVLARTKLDRLQQSTVTRRRAPTTIEHPPVETADSTLYFCRATPTAVKEAPAGSCDWLRQRDWWCAEKDLSALLAPLIDGSALEHLDLFVVDEHGKTLFERGNSGLRLAALAEKEDVVPAGKDAAPAPPRLPTLAEVRSSTLVRGVEVDGIPYKLFSQPIRLKAGDDAQYATWAVGVLVPLDGLQGDTQRMPLAVMAGVPLLCLLALLALPFLQLATAGAREPLTRFTVYGLALSSVVGTALLTLGGLDWYAYGSVGERVDSELRAVARALQAGFQDELRAAYGVLVTFRDQRVQVRPGNLLQQGYIVCTGVLDKDGKDDNCDAVEGLTKPHLSDFQPTFDSYPAFDILLLAGNDGWQREKWTTAKTITPVFQMDHYGAFTDVMSGRLLPSPGADGVAAQGVTSDGGLALNVMTSPNTGQVLTVLSVPIVDGRDGAPPRGVAMMIPKLLSLVDPIMPPDTGFAVMDNNGRVVFHSQQSRRLYENFFAEASGELPLRSAVFARRAGFFDLDYHGRPQRAFVQPLPDTSWSLVVYRSQDTLRTFNFEAVSVALLCFLGCVAGYVLWLLVARGLLGPGLRPSLWPDPQCTARYLCLGAALLLLAGWTGWVVYAFDGADTVLAAILAPLIALSLVVVGLMPGRGRSGWGWLLALVVLAGLIAVGAAIAAHVGGSLVWVGIAGLLLASLASWEPTWLGSSPAGSRRFVPAYVGVLVALLINLAVLPMAALFEDAFDLGVEALTHVRQLALAETMAAHQQRLQDEYRKIPNGALPLGFWRAKKWDRLTVAPLLQRADAAPTDQGTTPAIADGDVAPTPIEASVCRRIKKWFPEVCRDVPVDGHDPTCGSAGGPRAPGNLLAERCHVLGHHPSAAVVTALPVYGQDALELRQAVYRRGSDCSWGPVGDDGAISVQPPFVPLAPVLPAEYRVADAEPTWPQSGLRRGLFAAIGLVLLLTAWGVLRWLVARVFCLDAWENRPAAAGAAPAEGGYYLRPSAALHERLVCAVHAVDGTVVDLRTLSGPAELPQRVAHRVGGRVLIAHLEHGLDDPAWNKQKLATLEDLVLRRALPIDLTTELDVLPYFTRRLNSDADPADASYVSADEMARWAQVLASLDQHRADLPPAPLPPRPGESETLRLECRWTPQLRAIEATLRADQRWTGLSRLALIRHIGELANAHYRTLWASLTDEERLVLYHLATRGFVNPKKGELARRLMQRGLIRRGPALHLMNESFRQFVLSIEDRATIRGWERAAGTSTWQWVRNGVMAVAVVGGVFLFLTQPDAYAKWVGLLAALTTVGGGMTQVLGLFQGSKRAAGA
jgi:hypothetical protein